MILARFLILGFLVLVPIVAVLGFSISNHDLSRLIQLALGATCATVVGLHWVKQSPVDGSRWKLKAVLLTMAALALVSVLSADNPAWAFRELSIVLGLTAVAIVIAHAARISGDRSLVIATVSATALYSLLLIVLMLAVFANGQVLERLDLFVGYDNYRFYSHVQTVALPLAAVAIVRRGDIKVLRPLAWIALTFGFALLMFTASRGTALGLLVGCAATWICVRRKALPVLRCMALAAGAGLLVYSLLFVVAPVLSGAQTPQAVSATFGELQTDNSRFFLWRIAMAHTLSSPWIGIGPMHYAHFPNPTAAHPHNIYLQLTAEYGLPFAALLVALMLVGIWRLLRTVRACHDTGEASIGSALSIGCLAVAFDSAFSAASVMPVPQVWIAVLVGWTAGWLARNEGLNRSPTGAVRREAARLAAAALLVGSQAWLWIEAWPEIRNVNAHVERAIKNVDNPKKNPRFWSHGWF